jgi:hypothetical protein
MYQHYNIDCKICTKSKVIYHEYNIHFYHKHKHLYTIYIKTPTIIDIRNYISLTSKVYTCTIFIKLIYNEQLNDIQLASKGIPLTLKLYTTDKKPDVTFINFVFIFYIIQTFKRCYVEIKEIKI